MFATNHVLTGAVIGSMVTNPIVAIPVAFFAHFAIDALPHFGLSSQTDKKFLYGLTVDMALAAAILVSILALQPNNWLLIVASGVACASPDLMWLPRWLTMLSGKTPKPMGVIRRFHAKVQWAEQETMFGLGCELLWMVAMFAILSQQLQF